MLICKCEVCVCVCVCVCHHLFFLGSISRTIQRVCLMHFFPTPPLSTMEMKIFMSTKNEMKGWDGITV